MSIDAEGQLAGMKARVEALLSDRIARLDGQAPPKLVEAMRYSLLDAGKRLRPILCLAALEAVGTTRMGAHVRAACAIEIIHTYSLMHDDLPCMDDDDLRRGRPTAHRVHGAPAALLGGAALIPFACRLLLREATAAGLTADAARACVRELCVHAGAAGMVGGQMLDLEAERSAASLAELRRIHAMKTGALFEASLRLGGRLGTAGPAELDALGRYGAALGLAFQITDDVLDVTSDAAALGKTPGKDEAAGKTTFVSLLGLEGAREAAAAEAAVAVSALRDAGLLTPLLEELPGFAVHRDR